MSRPSTSGRYLKSRGGPEITFAIWPEGEESLASVDLSVRREQAFAHSSDLKWLAGALIIAAITFNALLCFVNTHVTPINNSYVIGSEIIIITIAILACYRTIDQQYALIIASIIVYTAVLALIRSSSLQKKALTLRSPAIFDSGHILPAR